MLALEAVSEDNFAAERSILNSVAFFNRISRDKETLDEDDVRTDRKDAEEAGAERFLIKDGAVYVGVMEYLMRNPKDGCVWLGLLVIDRRHQSKGYGRQALELFRGLMKERNVDTFRLGILMNNEPGLKFWSRNGFRRVGTSTLPDGKEIGIYEST